MRDPKRIPVILEKIRLLWETQPDTRLGQLIENLADLPFPGHNPVDEPGLAHCVFHVEDTTLEAALDKKLGDLNEGRPLFGIIDGSAVDWQKIITFKTAHTKCGGLTASVSPGSIGTSVYLECVCGAEENVSNHDRW